MITGLLILLVCSHYLTGTTLEDISESKPSGQSENEAEPIAEAENQSVELPDPVGPVGASVEIKVYVTSDNDCDTTTLDGMKHISNKYGEKVRIEFLDLLDATVVAQAQSAKISCKSGLTINGLSILRIPGRGVKGLVMFDGPIGQMNYDLEDVDAAVEYLLQQGESKPTEKADGEQSEGKEQG